MKVPVPACVNASGNTVQKNGKQSRTKTGTGNHPHPPLFSSLDVSTLKAPTGSSFVGQGFCGHHPPHSAGSLLDCVSTTERTLMRDNTNDRPDVQTGSNIKENNTSTFVRSVNDSASDHNRTSNISPKVKVSQISVTVKPNCVKTGTPPLANHSRRAAITGSLNSSARKSTSSPEPMSIGGDDTTSSEKGSRSPSPPRSSSDSQTDVSATKDHYVHTGPSLDNDSQNCMLGQKPNIDNAGMHTELSGTVLPTTEIGERTHNKNDNVNGNVNADHAIVTHQ